MKVRVFRVPYDSGHRGRRMGVGPDALAPVVAEALRDEDHETCVELVESQRAFATENGVGFELMRLVALRVRDCDRVGEFPIVLSGNCGVAVGTIAGLGAGRTGVLWLDAHGEFNTPDSSMSGFLDGMGLAIATGRAWRAMAGEIAGFEPLPDEHLVMVGTRDLDPAERTALDGAAITIVEPAEVDALPKALDALRSRVSRLYVHVDVDVLDERVAPSNEYGDDRGLAVQQVARVLAAAAERFTIAGLGVASYDPASDPGAMTPPVVARLVTELVR